MFFLNFLVHLLSMWSVLDPQILYEGMHDDYTSDHLLADYLENLKCDLYDYYNTHYANQVPFTSQPTVPVTATASLFKAQGSPQKVNFTSRYRKKAVVVDKLTAYFSLSWEDFSSCSPVRWWFNKCRDFPNLFHLAHDILSIPGMSLLYVVISWLNDSL